jgi:DNA-binding CsgD family transcriptional regulator
LIIGIKDSILKVKTYYGSNLVGSQCQQFAEELFITAGTVRVHIHAILQKLNVTDHTQAAIIALQRKLFI